MYSSKSIICIICVYIDIYAAHHVSAARDRRKRRLPHKHTLF